MWLNAFCELCHISIYIVLATYVRPMLFFLLFQTHQLYFLSLYLLKYHHNWNLIFFFFRRNKIFSIEFFEEKKMNYNLMWMILFSFVLLKNINGNDLALCQFYWKSSNSKDKWQTVPINVRSRNGKSGKKIS